MPPSRTKTVLRAIAALLLLVALGVGGYGAFAGFEAEPRPGDRERVVTTAHLAAFVADDIGVVEGTLSRRWFLFGGEEVNYTVESPNLYLFSSVSRENSDSDARLMFKSMELGVKVGNAIGEEKIEEQPRDDLLRWGDESRSTALMVRGQPAGHYFLARQGKTVFALMLTGYFIDDPAAFQQLVEPRLSRATAP